MVKSSKISITSHRGSLGASLCLTGARPNMWTGQEIWGINEWINEKFLKYLFFFSSLCSFRKIITNTYLNWMKIDLMHSDFEPLFIIKLKWKFKIVIWKKYFEKYIEIFDKYLLALSRESKLHFLHSFLTQIILYLS